MATTSMGDPMKVRAAGAEWALLGLFVLSGFAGLIYQSVWSHYLGLTLGHAAYAQTLVLAIFMGGMAGGAWVASRYLGRWEHLILAYAIVEAVIGLCGLLFHPAFMSYTAMSQDLVLPSLADPTAVRAYQWLSAAVLILPQCVLLGATFPLLSAGFLRIAPADDGRVLGGLYFTNSIGAAFGALAATFLLLPWIGMPGSITFAGGINLVVAVGAWWVWRELRGAPIRAVPCVPDGGARAGDTHRPAAVGPSVAVVLLWATFLSGAFSFVYEIGWIRLLNQALGTTVHSFELMLAAFISGLAFGGLWVRSRSSRITDAIRYAGYAQVWMGLAALASVVFLTQSFSWVGWLVDALPPTDEGYALFTVGSAIIALLIMFPAAFFAGMTLPLFTMALLRRGEGERSIGRVYAANTLGAIVGVMAVVHLLIPLMGVRMAVTMAALGDALLGLYLLRFVATPVVGRRWGAVVACTAAMLVVSLVLGQPDPLRQASGVFRTGVASLSNVNEVSFLEDGKTATIAVYQRMDGRYGFISTNGKPDASLAMSEQDPPTDDEITMLMAAALPLGLHASPRDVAVIGWGSGLTTHTMLGSPVPERVVSIEIERVMIEGAAGFGDRVRRAYEDPRSVIRIDDARTQFATMGEGFDIIISEPSNPWVSGVASLFTSEFYGLIRTQLREGGLFVQWLQAYEIDQALLMRMVNSLVQEFPHVDVYLTNSADFLFVAGNAPLADFDATRVGDGELQAELSRVGLDGQADYAVRRIGGRSMLQAVGRLYGNQLHSDFHPVVALNAPRSRFKGESALVFMDLVLGGFPVLEFTEGGARPDARLVSDAAASLLAGDARLAVEYRAALLGVSREVASGAFEQTELVRELVQLGDSPMEQGHTVRWTELVSTFAERVIGNFPPDALHGVFMIRTGSQQRVSLLWCKLSCRSTSSWPGARLPGCLPRPKVS
ncbi:spermine synthase [Alkalisalibacterium limincola]|uniref:spermine/spermidine synthase domain-containing protein n=1 Tax=Alkalisalibacterium limincola TaxID=2699169 RepID=UPI00164EFE62|nr:spermine synthase [Alkalisalibacterium limincola]